MSFRNTLLRSVLAAGATFALAGVAHAQKTDAGTSVSNTFTLDYQVGTTQQARITNETGHSPEPGYVGPTPVIDPSGPTLFTVDRMVDLALTAINAPAPANVVDVPPSAVDQTLVFSLTNDGNDNQSYSFDILDSAVGSAAEFLATRTGGLDIRFQRDEQEFDGASGITGCEAAQDVLIKAVALDTADAPGSNFTCPLAPGQSATVTIIGDIPGERTDGTTALEEGDEDRLILVAETRNPYYWVEEGVVASGDVGDLTVADGDGTNQIDGVAENVFADGIGDGDASTDGKFGVEASWVVFDPDLTAVKTVGVLEEGSSLAACEALADGAAIDTNAFSTPGACVEYRITVTNNGEQDLSDAEGITIVDDLPDNVIFVETILEGFDVSPAPTVTAYLQGTTTPCARVAAEDCVVTVSGAGLEANVGATPSTAVVKIRALIE